MTPRWAGYRILLVEDNSGDAELVAEMMSETAERIERVETLAAAGELLRAAPFDAVLLDLRLPDGAGVECVTRIRDAAPDAAIIVLTGMAGEAFALECLTAGAQDYIGKDEMRASTFRRAVDYAIARVEADRALRRSEQELLRSQRHLEAAQRIAATGSFELDPGTMLCAGSGQLCAMTGREELALVAWDRFLELCIPVEVRPEVTSAVEAARRGEVPDQLEFNMRRSDGVARKVLLRCNGQASAAGLPDRVIGVLRDVTELREAQARQAEIEEQLRHAQRLDALGTLAGGIAHDLNNTLTPIVTLGSMMLDAAGEDELRRDGLTLILDSAERARGLIAQILAFSRKGGGERQPVRLDQLVRDTLRMITPGLPITVRCTPRVQPVREISGNQGQLYQVVLNLVTNAAQAIGRREGTITIGVESLGARVLLYVQDNGAGMDEQTAKRIFEPFFTTKAAGEGTGLGLSVVSGIVADHGGTIALTSRPGLGTRFDVEFPVAG